MSLSQKQAKLARPALEPFRIWFLNFVERNVSSNGHFVAVMSIGTLLLLLGVALFPWALGSSAAAYIFPSLSTAARGSEIQLVFGVLIAMLVFVSAAAITLAVLLVRLSDLDLRQLLSQDPSLSAQEFYSKLSKTRFVAAIIFFGVMHHAAGNGGMSIYPLESIVGTPPTVAGANTFSEILWARLTLPIWFGFPRICVAYLLTPLAILTQACLLEVVFVISNNFSRLANKMTVNLALLDSYSAISNGFVRVVAVFSVLAAILILGTVVMNNETLMGMVFAAAILITLPFLVLLGRPIFILSKRIKDQKQIRLRTIQAMLLDLPQESLPSTKADLISEQMFVESRWEWPISAHLQKLVLFGLLPPFGWVLAAVIENLLY